MNSEQRVLKAIDHQEPDRVSLGYGAWRIAPHLKRLYGLAKS